MGRVGWLESGFVVPQFAKKGSIARAVIINANDVFRDLGIFCCASNFAALTVTLRNIFAIFQTLPIKKAA